MNAINRRIAQELKVAERQVTAAVELLDAGSTVPFIARYRKEATGALDDTQLRKLEERLRYLRELEERRAAILEFDPLAGQADRRSWKRSSWAPTPRRSWKTFICPTSPSAAPRRPSPARRASSRSPTACWPIRPLDPQRAKRKNSSTRKKA